MVWEVSFIWKLEGLWKIIGKYRVYTRYEDVLDGIEDLNKKIVKLGELNELAYEDLILNQYQFLCWQSCICICKECKKWRLLGEELQGCMGQVG